MKLKAPIELVDDRATHYTTKYSKIEQKLLMEIIVPQ